MPIRIVEKGYPVDDAWQILHRAYDSILKCEEDTFSKAGIPPQQYQVLRAIKYFPEEVTATSIANFLDRNHTSISLIINRMEKDGLVERKINLEDRRSTKLVITPKGEKKYKKAIKPAKDLPYRILSVLSEEELLALTGILGKVAEKTYEIRDIKDKVIQVKPINLSK